MHLAQISKKATYIGIMSGTSLDGVDVVAIKFTPQLEVLACASYPMPEGLKPLILELCSSGRDEIEKLGHLDIALGHWFAGSCQQLIEDNSKVLAPSDIAAIGLHGQTIRHRPDNIDKYNYTLQIGDPNTVAENTQQLVIADFRRRDMAAGGQGAPLAPAFHQSVFHSPENNRVIVNVGGMANLTFLNSDNIEGLIGFDTGPGNVLMDAWIDRERHLPFDKDGQWAREGQVDQPLLDQLLSLGYFQQTIPKSTGREQFNLIWLEQCIARLEVQPSAVDTQATLLELSATTIANEIIRYNYQNAQIFLCGGGAHNGRLIERLKVKLPLADTVSTTQALGLNPDWVEAAAFAWLARQTLAGLCGNSTTVTGAKGERTLGAIFQA